MVEQIADALGSQASNRADERIHRDGLVGQFHFRHTGLADLEPLGGGDLGQVLVETLLPLAKRKPTLKKALISQEVWLLKDGDLFIL